MKETAPIITTQKTCIEEWKRNSMLPYLDQIWFKLKIDKRKDTVTVSDWNIDYAKLLWIKWIEDWINEINSIDLIFWGSDFVWEFQALTWLRINQVLETPIWSWDWKSKFRLITTDKIQSVGDLEEFELFSKFPNLAEKLLNQAWKKTNYNAYEKASLWRSCMYTGEELSDKIKEQLWKNLNVKKSQWADNAIARMKERSPDLKFAGMEVVESWNTARQLWLFIPEVPDLVMPVSSYFYLNENSNLNKTETKKAWDLISELEAYFYAKANTLLEFDTENELDLNKLPELRDATISKLANWGFEYKIYLENEQIRNIIRRVRGNWAKKIFKSNPKIYYPDDSQVRQILETKN